MKNFGDSPKLGAPTVGLCLRPSLVFVQIGTVSGAGFKYSLLAFGKARITEVIVCGLTRQ